MVWKCLQLGLVATAVVAAGKLEHGHKALIDSFNAPRPVIFVKTHKTGSSTVATLLHRFSNVQRPTRGPCFVPPQGLDAHRWEFENDVFDRALATAQAWHIGAAASVEAATANSSVSNSSDTGDAAVPHALGMWTSHGPYSPFMHTLVPGRSVLVLSIVRNPVSRWLSAFNFYDLPKRRGYTLMHEPLGGEYSSNQRWWSPPRFESNHRRNSTASRELPPKLMTAAEVAVELIADAWRASNQGQSLHLADLPGTPSPWAFNGMSTELGGADEYHCGNALEDASCSQRRSSIRSGSSDTSGVNHQEGSQSALDAAAARLLTDRIAAGRWSVPRRPHIEQSSDSSSSSTGSGDGEICRCRKVDSSSTSSSSSVSDSDTSGGSELVMVLERFDESLVALKHFLGIRGSENNPSWPHSLLYLRGGVNRGSKPPLQLPPEAMAQLVALTTHDSWVYDAACTRLERVLACLNTRPTQEIELDRDLPSESKIDSTSSTSVINHGLCECSCSNAALDAAVSSPNDTSSNRTLEKGSPVALEVAALSLAMEHARIACEGLDREAQNSSELGEMLTVIKNGTPQDISHNSANYSNNTGARVDASSAPPEWTTAACKDLALSDYEWHLFANAALLPGSTESVKREAEAEVRAGLAPAEATCYLTFGASSATKEDITFESCAEKTDCANLQASSVVERAKKQVHFPCVLAEYSTGSPDNELVPLSRHSPSAENGVQFTSGYSLLVSPSLNSAPKDSCPNDKIAATRTPTRAEETYPTGDSSDATADSDKLHAVAKDPSEFNNDEWAALVLRGGCSFRAKARQAQDRGAAAVLLVDQPPSTSAPSASQSPTLPGAAGPSPMAKDLATWLLGASSTTEGTNDVNIKNEASDSLLDPPLRAAWAEAPSVPSLGALSRSAHAHGSSRSSGGGGSFEDGGDNVSGGRVRIPLVMLTQAVGETLVELLRIGASLEVHIEVS